MTKVMSGEIVEGLILYGEWGYEASYPEFYKVLSVVQGKEKWVYIQECLQIFTKTWDHPLGGAFYTTEGELNTEKPVIKRKVKVSGFSGKEYVLKNFYCALSEWDGTEKVQYNHH